jgi:hypothetical protein
MDRFNRAGWYSSGAMGKQRAIDIGEYDFDFAAFLVHLFL